MTAASVQRSGGIVAGILFTAGLVALQALIGGRVLLFAYPGLGLIAMASIVGVATLARPRGRAEFFCVLGTALFFGYLLLRAFASPGYFARPDLFSIAGALVVYAVTVTVLTSSKTRMLIFAGLLAFALVHVLIGVMQFTRGDNFMLIPFLQRVDYGQRASGFYVCPNHLAGLLEVLGIVGLSITCWSQLPMWGKVLIGYLTGTCYAGLALTGSRGGYVSAAASLLAFAAISLFAARRSRSGNWPRIALVGLIALVAVLSTAGLLIRGSGYLNDRAGNIVDSKNMRIELWRAAIQQWKLEPVFGTGSGTYRFYGRQFRTVQMQNDPIDVHNDYLHLLCEYGLVAAIGFLVFFGAHARQGWRTLKHISSGHRDRSALLNNRLALHIGALSAIVAYAVHSVFDFNLHIPANAALMAFIFGIVAHSAKVHTTRDAAVAGARRWNFAIGLFAILLMVQCIRLFPGEYFTEQARVALRDEDPAQALLLAERAVAQEPANPELYFYFGRALLATAHQLADPDQRPPNFEKAAEAFQRAHELAPLDGTYPLNLAFTYDELSRFDDAEHMYTIARARDPRSTSVSELYRAHLKAREKRTASSGGSL